jgi:hypothetical protein
LLGSVAPRLVEVAERVAALVERCAVCQVGQMLCRDFVTGSQVTAWRAQHPSGRVVYDTS